MPLRFKSCLCRCTECISFDTSGKLFDSRVSYHAHCAAVLAKNRNSELLPAPISTSRSTLSSHSVNGAVPAINQEPGYSSPPSHCVIGIPLSHDKHSSSPKKNASIHVARTMEILSTVEKRINECTILMQNDPIFWDTGGLSATLYDLRKALYRQKRQSPDINSLKEKLYSQLDRLQGQLLNSDRCEPANACVYNTDHWFMFTLEHTPVVVQCCFILIILCHIILNLSRRGTEMLIGLLRILLAIIYQTENSTMPLFGLSLLQQVPKTLGPFLSKVNLQGRTTTYAVCPQCHYLYPPRSIPGSDEVVYLEHCTHIPSSEDGVCNEFLGKPGSPLKTFVYNDFNDYVAGLLSRHDLESRIDNICDSTFQSLDQCPSFKRSIFDCDFLRSFEGPDSSTDRRKLFIQRGDEARLVFSLNFDFFHPEGMRVRGSTMSSGLISMSCLSLGLDICFLPENMYIAGIIPGPKEPSGHQCNHYLKPLIDDLERSWKTGVFYSRTSKYQQGRLARSAVILSVNDLPATRKLAGLANHNSHHYCSICRNYGRKTLSQTDVENWELRDPVVMREAASDWLGTQSAKARCAIFDTTGVRWSELWRLPYWNPRRQLAIDPMHCIFEGLVQRHVREYLELTTVKAKANHTHDAFFHQFAIPGSTYNDKIIKQITQIHKLLLAPLFNPDIDTEDINNHGDTIYQTLSRKLMQKNKDALAFVCNDIGSTVQGHKWDYVLALINWRKTKPLIGEKSQIKLVTEETILFIQKVIKTAVTPSWISSVPYNFGNAAAGTIKAEEWRNMSLIFLPIALIALWGDESKHTSIIVARRASAVLDHTMLLFNAARIMSLRNINEERVGVFQQLMLSYIQNLPNLYPESPVTVNNHMALHISLFLKDFGPTRSWWTFPFERLIGILQRENTNNAMGVFESTMLYTFLKKSKFRFWLAQHRTKPFISDCYGLLDSMTTWRRDFEDDDTGGDEHVLLPEPLRRLTHRTKGTLRARLKKDGVSYTKSTTHLGNSLILFHPGGNFQASTTPACIEYIISTDSNTQFVVRRHVQPENVSSPYSAYYPHFPARIFSAQLSSTLEMIKLDWVVGHFARWKNTESTVVILALSRE